MLKFSIVVCSLFCFFIASGQTNKQNSSFGVTIELPLINNANFYRYSPNGEGKSDNQTGFLGTGFSLYFQNNENKYSVGYENPSFNESFFAPKGDNSNLNADIFEAIVHHKISSQFAWVGGVNYITYHYHLSTDIPPFAKVDKNDATLGVTVGGEFVPAKSVSVAILYRPSVFCFDKKNYRAIFSFGLRYDINFWKKKST